MLSEDVKIRYAGFEPSHDVKGALHILLSELHLKSPHQSFINVTFTLTNGLIEGVIGITSKTQNFVAKATDVHLSDVGHKLVEKLGEQLDKWKSLRCF
jgi:hypothetical protein